MTGILMVLKSFLFDNPRAKARGLRLAHPLEDSLRPYAENLFDLWS